jgi:hypothetical protein
MMTQLNGTTLDAFPYKDFRRVEDLIYFDGPLLVHYTNQRQQDYLYHWVDNDEDSNRWLIYRVARQSLLNYIRGQEEFRTLLQTTSSDLILVVDVNQEGQHSLIQLVSVEDLPNDYIPAEDIYYEMSPPEFYDSWSTQALATLSDSQKGHYELLKSKAIYVNLKPTGPKHGTSPEVPQMVDYLKNINISYVEYAQANYEKRYSGVINDPKEYRRKIKLVREQSVLRGVDFGPGSFGVALAPDFVSSLSVLDQDVYNWLKDLPARFQEEVVDIDFTNPESIVELNGKYTQEQILKFLSPYLKIIENEDYQIAKADKHFKAISSPVRLNEKVREVLVEKPTTIPVAVDENPEKELVTLVVEKNKDQDISKMSGRQITSRILSTKAVTEYSIEIDSLEWRGKGYKLQKPLELKATFSGQRYKVQDNFTGTEGEGATSEEAVKLLKERMLRRYDLLKGMIADFRTAEQETELSTYRRLVIDEPV